jgi:hypothetical protein
VAAGEDAVVFTLKSFLMLLRHGGVWMDRQQIGSKKWRTSKWKQLLELVLPALDELPNEMTG